MAGVRAGDRVGFWTATACALHCALLPVAFAAVPAGTLGVFGSADLDQVFVLFAGVLALVTLSLGFRFHRQFAAWPWLLAGLVLLGLGAYGPLHVHGGAHTLAMVGGGLLLATAHWTNLRLTHRFAAAAPQG